jgi:small subunit ribosomal protein S16
MALKIRLRRMGRKKAPTYRLVVAESSMPRDGRFVANIGHYNPRTEPITLVVDREQALQWIAKGAKPTDTAHSLLRKAGVFKPEAPVAEAVEAVKETAKSAVKKAGDTAKKAGAAAKAAAETVADRVTETASEVAEKVTETASEVAETVRHAAEDVVEAVQERVSGGEDTEAAEEPKA